MACLNTTSSEPVGSVLANEQDQKESIRRDGDGSESESTFVHLRLSCR